MFSSTNDQGKTNQTLLSKMLHKKSTPSANSPAADDTASTMSGATLIQQEPMKSMPKEEQDSFGDLMAKANTMPTEEFKAYLARHKEQVDAAQRKQSLNRSWEYSEAFLRNEAL